jgi:exonuclease 3'-5' domain-containing protein 1
LIHHDLAPSTIKPTSFIQPVLIVTMKKRPSSQSVSNSTQENGLSTVVIESTYQLKRLLQDLKGLPIKPPSIYLDASGVGQGQLIDLQFLVPPTDTLYVINMRRLAATAMSALGDNGESLRLILESKDIPKVGFDIRGMSRILFNQLNVSLGNMYDLQLMELASRDDGQSKKFLAGLAKCIDQDIPSSNIVKRRWMQSDGSTNMHLFNSRGHVPRQFPRRVEVFPALWTVYKRKLGVPGELVWLGFARAESEERVEDSKKDPGRQDRQQLGPERWWDREQREAAIDDWNDILLMEIRVGHWELNDDAEWVPTHKEKNGIID